MEKTILTIQEILQKGKWIKTISEVRLITGHTGHAGRQRGEIKNLVKITSEGKVKEDKSIRWNCFEIDGAKYMYMVPAVKFEKAVLKVTTPELTLQEALKGRKQVTLDEVREHTGEKNERKSIAQMVKVTNRGIGKNGDKWYHFDMGGNKCIYVKKRRKKEKEGNIEAKVLPMVEVLKGRKQVTLDEVKKQTGNTRKRATITDVVKITDKGKDENGLLKWYHFDIGSTPCVYIAKRKESLKNIDKLKKDEQELAENKINLVYSFLRKYEFEVEEYYDTALFAYLRAVIKYSRIQELKEYSFSTIAYYEMKSACFQEAKKRKSVKLVSIEEEEEAGRADELFFRYEKEFKTEREGTIEILEDIGAYINETQKKMLLLLHKGYNFKETAGILKISVSTEEKYRKEIIRIAKSHYNKAI